MKALTLAVEPHGSITTLWIRVLPPLEDERFPYNLPVHFDTRCFHALWDERGPDGILNQEVDVQWDGPEGATVRFLDQSEPELTHDYKPGSRDGLAF